MSYPQATVIASAIIAGACMLPGKADAARFTEAATLSLRARQRSRGLSALPGVSGLAKWPLHEKCGVRNG